MSDDIDRAQPEIERNLRDALQARKTEGPTATGRCLYCDELLDDNARWCDGDHRDAWEKLRVKSR